MELAPSSTLLCPTGTDWNQPVPISTKWNNHFSLNGAKQNNSNKYIIIYITRLIYLKRIYLKRNLPKKAVTKREGEGEAQCGQGLNIKEHTHMGVFSVSGAKEDAQEAPNTDNTPMWVCSPRSMQGGRQRACQTRKAHSHGCAVRVRREGGEIERAEHREHTPHGCVLCVRHKTGRKGVRGDAEGGPCLARGGTQRA